MPSFLSNLFLLLVSALLQSLFFYFFFWIFSQTPFGFSAVSPTIIRAYSAFTLTCRMR